MWATNSAAQVSTILNGRGCRRRGARAPDLGLGASGQRRRCAGRRSPSAWRAAGRRGRRGPPRAITGSNSTISRMFSRNHGSMADSSWISARARARAGRPRRRRSSARRWGCGSSGAARRGRRPARSSVSPQRSCSSERTAFWSASLKVRPMAMTSPTDFIWVVSVGSASGNFSKAQRGILTTQ